MRLIYLTDLDNACHSVILTLAFREQSLFVKITAENLINEKDFVLNIGVSVRVLQSLGGLYCFVFKCG